MEKLHIGFSSCPNDTFIFDSLVNKRIDTKGMDFQVHIADVEELNRMALKAELDVTKISYYGYTFIADNYVLLDAGSALGRNNGPLLVSKYKIYPDELADVRIAIPGEHTTANLLLSIAFPGAIQKKTYLFSDIEAAVLDEEMDAGLLIHENRFTYEERGLQKIVDFGEYWEDTMKSPIPLGGIAIKRTLDETLKLKFNEVLKDSVAYAFEHPKEAYPYIRRYAQEMDEDVMYRHIDLYVNEYTRNLGKQGRNAIQTLYKKASELGLIPPLNQQIFLT